MFKLFKTLKFITLLSLISMQTSCAILASLSLATSTLVSRDDRSVGTQIDDKVIANKIRLQYSQVGFEDYMANISVSVIEGRVLLVGNVGNEVIFDNAEKIAWAVKGVKEVINEITVNPGKIIHRADDIWIANQIRAKYILEKGLSSVNFKVEVYDKVVYLFGIAKNQAELDKAIGITTAIHGVVRVVNHAIMRNDPRRS